MLASGVMRMLRGTVLSPLGRPPPWLPPRGSLVVLIFVMLVGVCSPVTWRKRGFSVKEMLKYGRFLQKTRGIVYLCSVSLSGLWIETKQFLLL